MTNNKILNITNNKITLTDNPNDRFDENYTEEYLLNLVELKKAKELNLLKEAIEKLS